MVRPLVLLILAATNDVIAQTVSNPGPSIGWTQAGPQLSAETCQPGRAPLMILGSYHMSNPGLDATNLSADDVLSPQRQAEIARTIEELTRFRPTKIAVEWPYKDDAALGARYTAYRAGTYQLTRNEVDQFGLRLAKRLGLATVSAVDYPMFMNGMTPAEFQNPKPPAAAHPAPASASPAPTLSPEDQLLRRSSVSAYLAHLNTDTTIATNASGYLPMLLPDTSTPALYAHADLVTNWYKRNLRIFANLTRITSFPDDRVLLMIGAGHIHILGDLALTSPYYCLVTPLGYLNR